MRGDPFTRSGGGLVRKFVSRLRSARFPLFHSKKTRTGFRGFGWDLLRHELRTPLTGILGMAELLRHSDLSGEQSRLLLALQESGLQLQRLIDTCGSIGPGKLAGLPVIALVNGLGLMEHIMRAHWPTARARNLELYLLFQHDLPLCWNTDAGLLRQVLDNLLSNALKFTTDGHVLLEARCGPGNESDVTFLVRDTGIGIPDSDSSRIYCVHEQGGVVSRRSQISSGFGLAVCSHIASRLEGRLSHDSLKSGGSCFRLVLPGIASRGTDTPVAVHPALTQRLKCRLMLKEPLDRVVRHLLTRMGASVENGGYDTAMPLPEAIDAVFCDSTRIRQLHYSLQTLEAASDGRPVLLWRHSGRAGYRPATEKRFSLIDLPKPLLPSSLESLLFRLALQRELQRRSG